MKKFILVTMMVLFSTVAFSNTFNNTLSEEISSKAQLEQAIKAQQGKVIYLDFWASWCGPCRKSFPWMNKMQAKYKEQGFVVISVNLDANRELAEVFLKDNPADFTVIYDPKGQTARHFKIQGMPSSMLIDRQGQIKVAHSGFFTKKKPQYEEEILQLIKVK